MTHSSDDRFRDPRLRRDGSERVFRLVARVNPQGDSPAYWAVESVDTGRRSAIREDRLEQYRAEEA